jgi:2-methylcitrate dehydratase PrpD
VASLVDRPAESTNRAAMLGSGQYVMAVTAMRGRMDLASFAQEFIDNNQVKSLMIKVKVKGEIELDRYFPQSWPGRVRIVLADGRSLTDEVIIPKGESDNPMSVPELEEKFLNLAAPLLGSAGANAVIGEVDALPERESLTGLLAALQLRG